MTAKPKPAKPKLNPRQLEFVGQYLIDHNATQAYIRAGYSRKTAGVSAFALLRIPSVRGEIQRREAKHNEKLEITAERIKRELALIAFSNMLDYARINREGQADVDLSTMTREQAAAIQEITVDATGGTGDGERRRVERTRFKLADKARALELLGKHKQLFPTNVQVSGKDGGPMVIEIRDLGGK